MGICPFSPMYGVKLHTIKSLNFLMTKPRPGIQPKKKKKCLDQVRPLLLLLFALICFFKYFHE